MNRSSIISLPHPSLRQRSTKVSQFDESLKQLVSDMEAATLDWEDHRKHELGVALAAVQINRLLRVIIVRSDFQDKSNRTFLSLVNPKIIRAEGEMTEDYEGCLSVPDIYGLVPRYDKVKIKAYNLEGREFRLSAEGFLARVLQHEIDHTEGKVFVDHIEDKSDSFFRLEDKSGKLIKLEQDEIPANILR